MAKRKAAPIETPPPEPGDASPVDWPAAFRAGADGLRRWKQLKSAERREVDLSGADLGGLDLTRANFSGQTACRASFAGATLARAELATGHFEGANFAKADLQGARLARARAIGATFAGARLAGADLTRGQFVGATFAGAALAGAILKDGDLELVDFTGADLAGAQLEGASFDEQTRWPAGFAIPANLIFAGKGIDPRLRPSGPTAATPALTVLIARLYSVMDDGLRKRTLDMLKSGRNQLYADVGPGHVRGIVLSQRQDDLLYSCVLTAGGAYICCAQDLSPCMGLRNKPCKHLLVLLLGLARSGKLDVAAVDRWVAVAATKRPVLNDETRNHVADNLLQYKGMQAGEVDWRPTETIPEDFYSF